jgi:cell division protein ZapA
MPQVEITIRGRTFEVACQDGEEHYLQSTSAMLDTKATSLSVQIGRMPESRMLLMAGLLLADRTAALEDRARAPEAESADLKARLEALEAAPPPQPERVEVPVVPKEVTETLAARA